MPYVPPHLRNANGSAAAAPSGGGDAQKQSSMNRSSSTASLGSSNNQNRSADDRMGGRAMGSSNRLAEMAAPQFAAWKPSERVMGFTEEQIADIRARLNVLVDAGNQSAPPPIESFAEMNLHANILTDIEHHKYTTPTPIQAQGIPLALSGRDILGCAETGSGKTASFSIPMVQHCLHQPPYRPGDGPIGLVLAPTRELAQQIEKEVQAFSRTSRLRTSIVVGGAQMHEQKHELRSGVDIIVATPGRFIDHLQQGNTNLSRVSFIVLDEADRMLDMGFEPQIKEVMSRLPTRHQTLLFSATMPKEIEDLANGYLNSPVTVKIGAVSTPTANVSQTLERANGESAKLELLVALLGEEVAAGQREGGTPMPLTVVFVERKTRCDEVAAALKQEGIPAVALHGGLGQGEREQALREFSAGTSKVLVATDVASRGLDIKGIGHVINMDLPKQFEDYVHRIGRTGRAGTRGRATSFWSDKDSFLVSQIKQALADLEKGNTFAFATGKEARKEERQLAQQFKSNLKMSSDGIVQSGSEPAVKVDDKFSFMSRAVTTAAASGAADSAWDD